MPNTCAFQIVWILSLARGGNCGTGKRYVRKYPLSFVAVWVHMQSCKQANSSPDIQNLWLEIFIELSFIELHISNRYGPLCYSLWVCVEELSSILGCLSVFILEEETASGYVYTVSWQYSHQDHSSLGHIFCSSKNVINFPKLAVLQYQNPNLWHLQLVHSNMKKEDGQEGVHAKFMVIPKATSVP